MGGLGIDRGEEGEMGKTCEACGLGVMSAGVLIRINGRRLCDSCCKKFRASEHAPDHGGLGVPAWLAEIRQSTLS